MLCWRLSSGSDAALRGPFEDAMSGRERVFGVCQGRPVDRLPVVPIVHTGLASLFEVTLGQFFTRAETMAEVMVRGCREFGLDGVQLSMGVTAEAEALGAHTEQPPNGAPRLREYLLTDMRHLDALKRRDPITGGRMPLFFSAVKQTVAALHPEAFVLATLRGPFLAASQLRGIEPILMDLIERPCQVEEVLEFTTKVALRLGEWLLGTGADGLALGEATCSPNFISPKHYRQFVWPCHRQLVSGLKKAGWRVVGLHICGNTAPILGDVVAAGVDFMDVDYQVSAEEAMELVQDRVVLRGNLDPSSVFRFGTPEKVHTETEALRKKVCGRRWILSSGCDIPPGTTRENLVAFATAARGE